jgi:RNA polymerase sigma factor (sigma-70 family)
MSAPPPNGRVKELFSAHSAAILSFLRAQLPMSPDDAHDLLQQTFLELQATLSGPSPPKLDQPRAYLFQIARHRLYRHIEKSRRAEKLLVAREFVDDPAVERHDTEFLAHMREDQRLILRAMRHVPLDQQIVLHLYYFTGLSASAIAVATERPEGTVRGQLRLGLEHMRKAVGIIREKASEEGVETTTRTLERWWEELQNNVWSVEDTAGESE